jgi:hypothetical protein
MKRFFREYGYLMTGVGEAMKRCLMILMILLIVKTMAGQGFVPSEEKKYQSFIGEVYTLAFFAETQGDYWEDGEIEYYYNEFKGSQAWLKKQAELYGHEIKFSNDYFFQNKEVVYVDEIAYGYSTLILKSVMKGLGYQDIEEYIEESRFDLAKNKLKIVLFVKGSSRSHARDYWSNSQVDLATIYCKRTSGISTDHYVISHEMLHQFGAWDLYGGESQSIEKAKELKELYPNSIMINTYFNKDLLEVDELTAWRVGWHHNFKKEYQSYEPVRTKKTKPAETSIKFNLGKKKNE